jgi:hypothetical protein
MILQQVIRKKASEKQTIKNTNIEVNTLELQSAYLGQRMSRVEKVSRQIWNFILLCESSQRSDSFVEILFFLGPAWTLEKDHPSQIRSTIWRPELGEAGCASAGKKP